MRIPTSKVVTQQTVHYAYLYRAVDKEGKTVDFLLTAKRDKAMQAKDVPDKVTMDKTGANKAAIDEIKVSS